MRRLPPLAVCALALAGTAGAGVASAAPAAVPSPVIEQTATSPDRAAATRAARWLAGRPLRGMSAGQQADIIVSLRIAGAKPTALKSRLRRLSRVAPGYATTPGAAAKIAMAAAAAGGDPTDLGGVDYLARTRRGASARGRFGRSAFDQALSMMALRAAGRRVPGSAVSALRATRSGQGWNFDLNRRRPADPDSTAVVIVALRAAGVSPRSSMIRSGVAWLGRRRLADGGWGADESTTANANSTGLAARALLASGRTATRPLRLLRSLQEPSGALRHSRSSAGSRLLATVDALPALAHRPYPWSVG